MKRLTSLILAVTLVAACLALAVSAVGNYYDSNYVTATYSVAAPDVFAKVWVPSDTDKIDAADPVSHDEDNLYGIREKLDASGTYVYNKSGADFMFRVVGCTQENGGYHYAGDTLKAGRIDQGCRRRIRQYVYENGHRYCMLWAASIYSNSSSTGTWSPDSIGSDPYCND